MAAAEGADAVNRTQLIAIGVCTRGRPFMLQRCLASLRAQIFDAAALQVRLIVIDNNETPITLDTQGVHHLHCPTPGIPMARNAAIEAALSLGADYIAFIDDDEIAPEYWIETMMQALEQSGADAVQGGVRKLPRGAADLALYAPSPPDKLEWEESESLATCNVLFKAHLVEAPLSLRFDEGMQFTGGSDREFFMRANKSGAKTMRLYGLDVFEEICEGRTSLRYECSRAFASGNNYFTRMAKNEALPVAFARIVLRAIASLLSALGKLVVAALLALMLQWAKAEKNWRKSCAMFAFAAGCLTPAFGIRAQPYRVIQGA
jgi:glycosyltransferase involved in cell wall biosynthesis